MRDASRALAVVACLVASSVRADMTVTREFRFVPRTPQTRYLEYYFVSLPASGGIPDVASATSASSGADPCSAGPDGRITIEDMACSWFTDRTTCGTCRMDVTRFDTSTPNCYGDTVALYKDILGLVKYGDAAFDPTSCYLVQVTGKADGSTLNRSALPAPCRAPLLPHVISVHRGCLLDLVPNPPGAANVTLDEMLCGQKDVDWVDADGDGKPDTCTGGLFDGAHRLGIEVYDNDPDTYPATNGQWVQRVVQMAPWGPVFFGTNFPVPAGTGAEVEMLPGQQDRTFQPWPPSAVPGGDLPPLPCR